MSVVWHWVGAPCEYKFDGHGTFAGGTVRAFNVTDRKYSLNENDGAGWIHAKHVQKLMGCKMGTGTELLWIELDITISIL